MRFYATPARGAGPLRASPFVEASKWESRYRRRRLAASSSPRPANDGCCARKPQAPESAVRYSKNILGLFG